MERQLFTKEKAAENAEGIHAQLEHFSVNQLMAKESVKRRLEDEDTESPHMALTHPDHGTGIESCLSQPNIPVGVSGS